MCDRTWPRRRKRLFVVYCSFNYFVLIHVFFKDSKIDLLDGGSVVKKKLNKVSSNYSNMLLLTQFQEESYFKNGS